MHMSVQLKKMEAKLRSVDLIIEVHDARIPITGRNQQFFRHLYAIRPHILVLNKCDLIDMKKYKHQIEDYYYERGVQKVLFTDCKKRLPRALNDVKLSMLDALENTPRFNRTVKTEYQAMVVGIPNVGKSSLINAIRTHTLGIKRKAVEAGARPGVTVRVQNRVRILDKPPVYIIDTPGVLSPNHRNVEDAMKLAMCDLVLESHVNLYYLADFLLFWLNRSEDFSYLELLGINQKFRKNSEKNEENLDISPKQAPIDDIQQVLALTCAANDFRIQQSIGERWDFDRAAKYFIQLYRNRKFKDSCLDNEHFLYRN
ncbi:Mitochondrial GTPase 1 [Caenorhabditis elegans]|nr:Mitochondrial GTPase 1 [Caenorhabditis elegans]CAG4685898.1 Mitochondrial GTPase 1 [Caenorhabditis elegans]